MTSTDELAEALASRTEWLCAIPSVIGGEREICDEVERWARGRFGHAPRVKNSLVVWVDGARAEEAPSPRPLVLLCGHLDTVPKPDEPGGHAPRRDGGGRIVAPGASDMKSGVAVAMEIAERVPSATRFCDLALVLYSREEGPYEENELGDVLAAFPELGRARLAICLEPTDNAVQLGCVGSIHATFQFDGRAAHSARPWQGENAIHKAWALLEHLAKRVPREAESGGFSFREVLSATRIEGGHARNAVPAHCRVNLNFRFAPDRTLEGAAAELRDLAERFGASATPTDLSPACPAFADHPLVQRLIARTGAAAEPKQAWTDVARLAQAAIPALNFGPGATAQAHQPGEWVEIASIARCYRMLEAFLG
jgi:succinyl-diaminopimelate desuccinylase